MRKKLLSTLLALSMAFTILAVSASAAKPAPALSFPVDMNRAVTPSTTRVLTTSSSTELIPFNISAGYNWWKIAIAPSVPGIRYTICRWDGTPVFEHTTDITTTTFDYGYLPAGNYLISVYVAGGGHNLGGTLWYKTATTVNGVNT